MGEKTLIIPAVALRGMTILPGMIAHFDVSRKKSLKAIEAIYSSKSLTLFSSNSPLDVKTLYFPCIYKLRKLFLRVL